jgi:hypothetical protein
MRTVLDSWRAAAHQHWDWLEPLYGKCYDGSNGQGQCLCYQNTHSLEPKWSVQENEQVQRILALFFSFFSYRSFFINLFLLIRYYFVEYPW